MKILVLGGGLSPEHDVSMRSGALVASALEKRGHDVALCDIFRPVADQACASFGRCGGSDFSIPKTPASTLEMEKESKNGRLVGEGVIELCMSADVCFLTLHGGMGEDGHAQALLESYGVAFTGSGMAACHAAMNKHISKLLCREAGMNVPEGIVLGRKDNRPDVAFPAVVKPCSCGSSVGVSLIFDGTELDGAIEKAFGFDDKIIIERMIVGREFSVSVLGDAALPSVEILPHGGVYDFESKYQSGMTEEICPGRLSVGEEKEIGRLALCAHRALGLDGFSRSDFILGEDGVFYYLETNAIPGLTEVSLLPRAAKAAGIEYGELCEKICMLAKERKKK